MTASDFRLLLFSALNAHRSKVGNESSRCSETWPRYLLNATTMLVTKGGNRIFSSPTLKASASLAVFPNPHQNVSLPSTTSLVASSQTL